MRLHVLLSAVGLFILPLAGFSQHAPPRFDKSITWKHCLFFSYDSPDTLQPTASGKREVKYYPNGDKKVVMKLSPTKGHLSKEPTSMEMVETYNANDLCVRWWLTMASDTGWTDYLYNEKDSLIQEISVTFKHSFFGRRLYRRHVVSYTPQALISREENYRNDTLETEITYRRDQTGQLDSLIQHYIEDGDITRVAYRYDRFGRLAIKKSILHREGLDRITEYKYGSAGKKVSELSYLIPTESVDSPRVDKHRSSGFGRLEYDSMLRANLVPDSLRLLRVREFDEYLARPRPQSSDSDNSNFRRKVMQLEKFDSAGRLIEKDDLRDDSTIEERDSREYFANGVLRKETEESFDSKGNLIPSHTTQTLQWINEHGDVVRSEHYREGKLDRLTKYEYIY